MTVESDTTVIPSFLLTALPINQIGTSEYCLQDWYTQRIVLELTELGIANDEALLLHFFVGDLSFQKLFQVLRKLSFNDTSDGRQGIGGVFKLLESLELDTVINI
jgi:hypothetical protein